MPKLAKWFMIGLFMLLIYILIIVSCNLFCSDKPKSGKQISYVETNYVLDIEPELIAF
jgi:hypothetical protein